MEQAPEYTSYTHYLTAVPYPRTNSYAISIGTIIRNLVSSTNIMKNILGEQVLGLPGEPRSDKDIPWIDVPRG